MVTRDVYCARANLGAPKPLRHGCIRHCTHAVALPASLYKVPCNTRIACTARHERVDLCAACSKHFFPFTSSDFRAGSALLAFAQPAESLALLVSFLKSGLSEKQIITMLSIFSCIGPVGKFTPSSIMLHASPSFVSIIAHRSSHVSQDKLMLWGSLPRRLQALQRCPCYSSCERH